VNVRQFGQLTTPGNSCDKVDNTQHQQTINKRVAHGADEWVATRSDGREGQVSGRKLTWAARDDIGECTKY